MTRQCCQLGCRFAAKRSPDVSFTTFSFPNKAESPIVFSKWCKFALIKEEEHKSCFALCAEHFEPDCFSETPMRKRLKKGSVPTIHDFNEPPVPTQQEFIPSTSHAKSQIVTFNELKSYVKTNFSSDVFMVKFLNSGILFYIIEDSEPFDNVFSLKIDNSKSVTFYSRGIELNKKAFLQQFTKPYFIASTEHLVILLKYLERMRCQNVPL